MKFFTEPSVEVMFFAVEDVIAASVEGGAPSTNKTELPRDEEEEE